MKIQLRYLFILYITFISIPLLRAANINFGHISTTDGLSDNQVNYITKDSKGFVWFANKNGLNRFDGTRIRVYQSNKNDSTAMPDSYVETVEEAYDGRMWLSSYGGIYIFDPLKEIFITNLYEIYGVFGVKDYTVNRHYIDDNKNIWLLSPSNVFYFEGKKRKLHVFPVNPAKKSGYGRPISVFKRKDLVWIAYEKGVIEEYDSRTLKLQRIDFGLADYFIKGQLKQQYNLRLFADSDFNLWIYGLDHGVFVYDRVGQKWSFNNPDSKLNSISSVVNSVKQDFSRRIWLASEQNGIYIFDKMSGGLQNVKQNPMEERGLSHNSVQTLYVDDLGIVWVGTFKQGVDYYHKDILKFKIEKENPYNKQSLPYNDINCFLEDRNGNLWMGTNGDGLIVRGKTGEYKQYRPGGVGSLSSGVIVSLRQDSLGRIWIGTYLGGVNVFDGKSFKVYKNDEKDPFSVSSNSIWDIVFDKYNRLWVATLGGGIDCFDSKMKKLDNFSKTDSSLVSSYALALLPDGKYLHVGTGEGVSTIDLETMRPVSFFVFNGRNKCLSNVNVNLIFKDSRGLYWIGTREGLNCYNKQREELYIFGAKDGLPDNIIHSVVEDQNHCLWVSTLKGICRVDFVKSGGGLRPRFITFDEKSGLQSPPFNYKAGLITADNTIYFAGAKGINYFNADDIKNQNAESPVVFTDFQIYNKSIRPGQYYGNRIILQKSISATDRLELNYNDNFFSLEFAALNYFMPGVSDYYYKLDGFNAQWLKTDANMHKVTFTNLSPGKYTLLVKAALRDGQIGNITRLIIVIRPPWWLSNIAVFCYILLVVLVFYFVRRSFIEKNNKKIARNREKMEAEKLHKIDEMKLKFFTNISHEFRTPLTLIQAPIEKLAEKVRDAESQMHLEIISRNAQQLLSLVNQVLDFRKLEDSQPILTCSRGDIIDYLSGIFSDFSGGFEKKDIRAGFNSTLSSLLVNFDQEKIRKIVSNLLSNALKFTPRGGEITMLVEADIQSNNHTVNLKISVSDNGIGIPEEHQEKIFERFYQVSHQGEGGQGSGIGLHLVKEYLQLMQGDVEMQSVEGEGSKFTIRLPLELIHLEHSTTKPITDVSEYTEGVVAEADHAMPLVLVVEDNPDLRVFLRDCLKENYRVIEAANGAKGLEMARKQMPDLIISDIMMPVMDGMEMCKRLKSELITSHIPIILLTAKISEETKLMGLQIGIDDYITKPFNLEELLLKIRNIANQRELLQKRFQKKIEVSPDQITITSLDEKLLEKAIKIVEDNMSNSELSVEEMSRLLGMSRVQLYKKLLSITGKTPIEFIRIIRLKRAALLLEKSQMSVSEIAYEVGFNTPRYFSRYFKEEYNMTPSAYCEMKGATKKEWDREEE